MPLAQPDAGQQSLVPDGSTVQALAFRKSSGDLEGPGPVRRSPLRPADMQHEDTGNPTVSASAASPQTADVQRRSSRQGIAAGPTPASVEARDWENARHRHAEGTLSPGQPVTGMLPDAASPSGQGDSQYEHRQTSVEMKPGGSTSPNTMGAQSKSGAAGPDSTSHPTQYQQSGSAAIAESHSSRESGQPGTALLTDTDIQVTAAPYPEEGTGCLLEQHIARHAEPGEHGSYDLLTGALYPCHSTVFAWQ